MAFLWTVPLAARRTGFSGPVRIMQSSMIRPNDGQVSFDACPVLNGFVPVKGDGFTFKDGGEESNNVTEDYDSPSSCEKPGKPAYYTEITVVKEEK